MTRVIRIFVAIAVLAAPPGVIAQSEKISIRMAPRPGQTVRLTMAHEVDMDISFDAAAPGLMPMKMVIHMTAAMTQKTGALNPDGTINAEFTYDQFRIEMSMNGQTMPANTDNPLTGKPVVVTYNRNGDVVSVQGMPAALSNGMFEQLMGSFVGNLPATALAVGETTTAPMDLALPLPLPGAPAIKMAGQTRLTLVSVEKDARGRSARFESTTAGTVVSDFASPDGRGTMAIDLSHNGDGTYVLDLDTGTLRSNIVTSSINGKMNMPGGAASPALPGMTMRGTISLTLTSD